MEYSKKILDTYTDKLINERFSTEIAILVNEKHLEEVESEKKAVTKRLKRLMANLEGLEIQKKAGIKDRELREQNKTMISVLSGDVDKRRQMLADLEGKKKQVERNLELYKDYIETIDLSIEIAKDKVSV